MLSCKSLTVRVSGSSQPILSDASLSFKPYAMNAVIGPSGCGKTTLLKAMLKILPSEGESYFMSERINKSEDLIGKVGFAPQFTCAHAKLTVRESLQSVLDISISDAELKRRRIDYILDITGLKAHSDKFVSSLSGGQLRRLGLSIELANNPPAMFCDEITSGLDPLSENNILDFLRNLCDNFNKTFICIIHNLAKLDYFDLVTVIYEAEVVFQGTLAELKKYFEIENQLSLYDKLNSESIDFWRSKWAAEKEFYHAPKFEDYEQISPKPISAEYKNSPLSDFGNIKTPHLFSQLLTLLNRRLKLFSRDIAYLFLSMAITVGFPIVVVIFALDGLPQIESLSVDRNIGFIDELRQSLKVQFEAAQTSTLVTGLILFQVILLALMGSNNSAREIASERAIYEKERLVGLSPTAYALSKILFTTSLAIFQGLWMCIFVKYICNFPGGVFDQCLSLSAICVAMTLICLAFSAVFSSADKANLVSIYLVGFQLPLSGIVLALPEAVKWICRPLITSYWGWAGYMASMKDTRIYDAYIQTQTNIDDIPSVNFAVIALSLQCVFAIYVVFWGCHSKKWQ